MRRRATRNPDSRENFRGPLIICSSASILRAMPLVPVSIISGSAGGHENGVKARILSPWESRTHRPQPNAQSAAIPRSTIPVLQISASYTQERRLQEQAITTRTSPPRTRAAATTSAH
jgi:hypothetical protein